MSKVKSSVWNYFIRKNKDEAQCTTCQKTLKCSGGSTTSLMMHLKKIHQIDIKQDCTASQPPLQIAPATLKNNLLTNKSTEEEIKKVKSGVWNYFVRIRSKDEAECTTCQKTMKSAGGSTSSLILHLKKIHQIDIKQDADLQPPLKRARPMKNSISTNKSMEETSKLKSSVWNYFVRKSKDEAQCTTCLKTMKSSGGSTTSLTLHLKKIHQIDIKQDTDQPLALIKRAQTLKNKRLTKKSMEEEVSKLAAFDGFSFHSIAKSNFIQRSLDRQKNDYDEPAPKSANEVRDMVLNFYRAKKNELVCQFKDQLALGVRYSLTLDEYASIQNKRYMNINVHTQDNHWSLGLIEINGSLDSIKTEEIVRKHLHDFGLNLNEHIAGCTTDGASVMANFDEEIKPYHQQCIAHCIHLSVIDTLYENELVTNSAEETEESDTQEDSEISEDEGNQQDMIFQTDLAYETGYFPQPKHQFANSINKVRQICKLFQKSATKNEILQEFIRASFMGKEYKLILDCRTRWYSTFYMIERFLKLKSCITKALQAVLSTEVVLDDEWETLNLIHETLRPVEMILKAICAEDAGLLKAETSLEFLLGKLYEAANPLALQLHQNLSNHYQSRRNVETVALLSYLHNPRKFMNDQSSLKAFGFPTKPDLMKYACQAYNRLFPAHHEHLQSTPELSEENEIVRLQTDVISPTSNDDDELLHEYTCAMKKLNEETKKDTCELEISKQFQYFEATLNRSEELEKLYKALLTIKATSVASERAFVITGLFRTKVRTNLSGKTLDVLCFLKNYFQKTLF